MEATVGDKYLSTRRIWVSRKLQCCITSTVGDKPCLVCEKRILGVTFDRMSKGVFEYELKKN